MRPASLVVAEFLEDLPSVGEQQLAISLKQQFEAETLSGGVSLVAPTGAFTLLPLYVRNADPVGRRSSLQFEIANLSAERWLGGVQSSRVRCRLWFLTHRPTRGAMDRGVHLHYDPAFDVVGLVYSSAPLLVTPGA